MNPEEATGAAAETGILFRRIVLGLDGSDGAIAAARWCAALARTAEQKDADVIVVGAHGHGSVDGPAPRPRDVQAGPQRQPAGRGRTDGGCRRAQLL